MMKKRERFIIIKFSILFLKGISNIFVTMSIDVYDLGEFAFE